ncbi:MAG: hypothetical protein A2051_08320 [Desulfovibrionales bacterium GWA2_65_9]|nr:MAG: hypothetical protein A2051_08320 [Desulfovibrionales bacterium GWA2_65_9]
MQTPESPAPTQRNRPLLLIHNLFNYGHFLVYADTLTQWALARGFRVTLMGRGLEGTQYQRRYLGAEQVEILDMGPSERLDQQRADLSKADLATQAFAELLEAQRELRPEAAILLSTDEFIFHAGELLAPDFTFPAPTVGLVTFGHRDCYLGFKDLYAARLDQLLAARRPFSSVLTLDEYQVAALDSGEEHLVFLPDIYADPPDWAEGQKISGQSDTALATADAEALRMFLDHVQGSVLPLLGKLDQRKNALWTLRAVNGTPEACCVVLGQRVSCPDDAEIDALLERLTAQGRAFVRQGYVPEALFRLTLGHARTAFLPLPYSCHYGSSGLQLQALAAGKPTLVPDVGLMALRVQAHGLGLCYGHGDEQDFRRAFAELLAQGPEPYADALRRFMACFTPEARSAQLDRAFGLARQEGTLLARLTAVAHGDGERTALLRQGLSLGHAGRAQEALTLFDRALALRPGDAAALLRKALTLHALDRREEADEAMRHCLDSGGTKEFDFVLRAQLDLVMERLGAGDKPGALERLAATLRLAPADGNRNPVPGEAVADESPIEQLLNFRWQCPWFSAVAWQRIGAALAQTGRHEASVRAFRKALTLAPDEHDFRLNISDVLRYAKRYDDSEAVLGELAALAPEYPGLHHKRGQVLFERGLLNEALAEFRREPPASIHHGPALIYMERIAAQNANTVNSTPPSQGTGSD